MADDYPASTATSGVVAPNGSVTGTIDTALDRDWFALTANAGQAYVINLLGVPTADGTLYDPYLYAVRDSAGAHLGYSNDDGGVDRNSRINFIAPTSGLFFIEAGGYSTYAGTYRLSVTTTGPTTPVDDFAATTATTGTVAVGGTATGAIEVAADQDWFAATLTGGQSYIIDLRGEPTGNGTLSDTYLRGVYDAGGNVLAGSSNDDSGGTLNSQIVVTPAADGTYYIAAGAYSRNIGTYQLALATNGPTDDFLASTGTTGTIAVGGTATGTIGVATDRDWFRVTLTAGQSYVIDLRGAPTGHGTLDDPWLDGIYDSAGHAIDGTGNDDFNSLNSQVTFTPTATGTYYIAAGGYSTYTGTYQLAVASNGPADDFAAGTATTGTVAIGGFGTGSIERSGDNDWFAVSLTGGIEYRLNLNGAATANGTLADPYLRGIHDSAGSLIDGTANDDFATLNSQVTFVPATTGTYFVAASGFGAATGTYRLGVVSLGSADDFAATTATAGTIAVNGTSTGRIETANDQDWFGIDLVAGRRYQIDLVGAGTPALSDTFLRGIYTEAGAPIAGTEDDDGGDGLFSQVTFTATASGRHFISAGGFGSATGGYSLSVAQLAQSDDYAASSATTGTLAAGSHANGSIETAGDQDWFAVTLAAGSRYRIDLTGIDGAGGTLADTYLRGVRTPDGTLVPGTADDDSGEGLSSQAEFVAPEAGTFYVDVGAFAGGTGTYTVALAQIVAPTDDFAADTATSGVATPGTFATGSVETGGDQDWFGVALTAGHAYRIDLMGAGSNAGTLSDPYLRGLYDAAGTAIPGTSDDDGGDGTDSRTLFAAPATGTYFVAAGAFGTSTGSYKLLVQDLGATDDFTATTATTGTAAVGGNSAGSIETSGDQDWFRIAFTAGTTYQIDLRGIATGNGSLADPVFRGIYDQTGAAVINTEDDDSGVGLDSQLVFTAGSTGDHFLAAGGFAGTTGSYKLTVTQTGTAPPADDFTATVATAGTVAVGASRTGGIETASDQDWFAVTLAAGETYDIGVEGTATNSGTLPDPYLRGIYDSAGTLINGTARDDGGNGLNSLYRFTAPTAGTYYIAAGAAGTGRGSYKVTVTHVPGAPPPPPAASTFGITINFTGNQAYQPYFTAAASTWQSVITADLPDVSDPNRGFVDDLLIDASVVAIDGPGSILGQAGPRAFRDGSSLPYLGMMQFDEADLAGMVAKGILQDVIEHEMGHVLGLYFGMWQHLGLAANFDFTGANALAEYRTLTGVQSASVPLETGGGGGTRQSHWSESVFDRELMTGYAEQNPPMPLSRVTIGALQDMGYTVSYAAAETYVLPGTSGLSANTAPGGDPPANTSSLGEGAPPITGDPAVAAAATGFTGARLAYFEDKPLVTTPAPAVVKLDGTVTSASATTVLFYETTTGNNHLVELTGTFDRNNPATAGAVKGSLTQMQIFGPGGLIESYDYAASPRDVETVLANYIGTAYGGDTLVESRAATAQNDQIATGTGNDIAAGALGDDIFAPGAGNDRVFGGAGTDTTRFSGARGDYRIGVTGNVVRTTGTDGQDWLEDIEQLQFGATAPITLETLLSDPSVDALMSFLANGRTNWVLPDLYAGPLTLNYQFNGTEAGEIGAGTPRNDFMNLLGGNDAANLGAGDDVLDGGGGSNFLTGGAGHDIYFTDARGFLVTWSTITDWEVGEQLAVWGWIPGTSTATWSESAGAPGYTGATMFADVDGVGGVETVVTWSGKAIADVQPLQHELAGLLWFY